MDPTPAATFDWLTLLHDVLGLVAGALVTYLRMREDAKLGRSLRPPPPKRRRH